MSLNPMDETREFIQKWIDNADLNKLYMAVKEQKEFLDGAFLVRFVDDNTGGSVMAAYKGDHVLVLDIETNGL